MNKSIFLAAAMAAGLALSGTAFAAESTVRVDGAGDGGWVFNGDERYSTPFEFTLAEQSIGTGSLHVLPIAPAEEQKLIPTTTRRGADKFIAGLPLGVPASELQSISYDFKIAGPAGDDGDADDFYLNLYTLRPGSTSTFSDCRLDYVPATGSTLAFTTAEFSRDFVVANTHPRTVCPTSLAQMGDEGWTVRAMALNVGGTSTSDAGLAGYFDNVVVTGPNGDAVTYDFEASPQTKDDCKGGGFEAFGSLFTNQGECVSSFGGKG